MRTLLTYLAMALLAICSTEAFAKDINPFRTGLLPSWPIDNVGDPIPDELIASWKGDYCKVAPGKYAAFPSKGNLCLKGTNGCTHPRDRDAKDVDASDPGGLCDDGDQTTYNGLLCAAGDSEGCAAVERAQDGSGRWFRSPHRLWMSNARCAALAKSNKKQLFNDNCAYGFSPDMNLGVLLYTLRTRDVNRYNRWLRWLDNESKNTKLCTFDVNREPTQDCIKIEWPRVCTDDLGHLNSDEDPGFAIDGRYGGKCALRPWDTLDFSAVNDAVKTSFPPRLAAWDLKSRGLISAAKGAVLAIPGGVFVAGTNPLVLMSTVDAKHFPTHLDAIRVLIRMMILNPSMQMNNLPDLPDPESLLPDIMKLGVSDGADLMTIRLSATAIATRVPWDPFYQLLANGPTPTVRSKIILHCPAAGDRSIKSDWIWEKANDQDGSKLKSMGWDCVFVAKLYNKMRVKKNIFDELFAMFLKYGDGVEKLFTKSKQALQAAQAGNEEAQKANHAAKKALDDANEFVGNTYKSTRDELDKQRVNLENGIQQATTQVNQLRSSATSHAARLAACAPSVLVPTPPRCDRWVGPVCVQPVGPGVRSAPNPLCEPIKKAVNETNSALTGAQNTINSSRSAIDGIAKSVKALDDKLADTRQKLQKGTLQAAYNTTRTALDLKGRALSKAEDEVAHLHAAYTRARNYACVWKSESKCEQ
ncbi:hypothetical protein [Bradyrhizobium sp. AUGA SZCCT0283]|uniref:hypothetical protein n=1 Tax=Bradyrhizobium sp. AUGA SZCCT0283 TaxID=2807671 RepID=UPI001BAA5DE2|nr:hypothetical protein [Bradyrhizobium sp. AUGA SZCCT0283]MBR1274269.1 hypothetical protein [Bradyrhizobium sp. AUGA SZCCT0283]